ncbi:MAG TPA: protein-disulfide isomerase, partial [Nitrosopumilus sp.]|nr:protein-disulfide isomerase [Nitrosopumilus sp.]
MIHGPSLGIGAAIASIALIVAFVGFDSISNESELVMEPAPTVQQAGPAKITINTFIDNGSPSLGSSNA